MKLEKILQLEEPIICCENKEQSNKLFEKLEGLGCVWASGTKLTNSDFLIVVRSIYYIIREKTVTYTYTKPDRYYTHFVDIDDFKEQENHEKDVFYYKNGFVLPMEKFNWNYKISFLGEWLLKEPKNMLIVNKKKKYVLLKLNGKEYRVDCHEEDKFNWLIGFGLALSKYYGNWNKSKNAREYFRNPKTHKLNYKEYAKWCVFDFFMNDTTKISDLQNKVKEINEYGKVDL